MCHAQQDSRSWETKVITNRCFSKKAKKVESDIQRFAGGPGKKKKPGTVSRVAQATYSMDGIAFVFQQKALKSSLQSSCQTWSWFDVRCIVLLNVLAHMGL